MGLNKGNFLFSAYIAASKRTINPIELSFSQLVFKLYGPKKCGTLWKIYLKWHLYTLIFGFVWNDLCLLWHITLEYLLMWPTCKLSIPYGMWWCLTDCPPHPGRAWAVSFTQPPWSSSLEWYAASRKSLGRLIHSTSLELFSRMVRRIPAEPGSSHSLNLSGDLL